MVAITIVVEGRTDEPVARKLVNESGLAVAEVYVQGGKGQLDARLARYTDAAVYSPWFILRDLDQDAACAPVWLRGRGQARWRCLRLAVRQVEAWLLADRSRFADFFSLQLSQVPLEPEALTDAKRTVVDLAKRSRSARVRRGLVPPEGSRVRVGPTYEAMLIEYVANHWRPRVAARNSDSLRRGINALEDLARRWTMNGG